MNALMLGVVQFDAPDAWADFDLNHVGMHQAVYEAMLRRNLVPFFVPLAGFPREENADYLLSHWQVHVSQARLLGLPGIPDLATVDLTDRLQFEDWTDLHAKVHANENLALGLR